MAVAETDIAAIRFGFGRLAHSPPTARLADLVDQVKQAPVRPAHLADIASPPRIKRYSVIARARDKNSMASVAVFKEQRHKLFVGSLMADSHAKIAQAVASPFGFVERLVQFWSNHFTVSAAVVGRVRMLAGPFEMEVIRPHLGGRFADLLIASTLHPAMLDYLNQRASVGPDSMIGKRRNKGLNENLAREVLELHTLGAEGGYTQRDVVEFARLLTGLNYDNSTGLFRFRRSAAEPGIKTILGRTYGGGRPGKGVIVAALEDLARHPATARHVARQMCVHFIADDPSPDTVARLAARFAETDGNLPDVYEALLTAPEAVARFGEKRKTPYDFLVSALRTMEVPPEWLQPVERKGRLHPNPMTLGLLLKLDEGLWRAPSPAGWPDLNDRWITPAGLADRLDWIGKVAGHAAIDEPIAFLDAVLGSTANPHVRGIIANAASRRSGLALVLASAEFNSR